MKTILRLFPILTAFLFLTQTAAAQDSAADSVALKHKQDKIQTEIIDALSKEGFRASIVEDGDITFRESGKPYYITLRTLDVGTKLRFYRGRRLTKAISPRKLLSNCNKLNQQFYSLKCSYDSDLNVCVFGIENWIQNSSDFTNLFITDLILLQAAEAAVFDEIDPA